MAEPVDGGPEGRPGAVIRALRVVLVYAVVAGAWILVSDELLAAMPVDEATRVRFGQVKGWGFVAVTALALFVIVLALERSRAGERDALAARAAGLRRLASLVEHSPIAIVVTDLRGTVLEWNPAAERLWGLPAHAAIGTFAPWVPPEDRDAFHALLREVAGGRLIAGDIRRRRSADGTEVLVRVSNAPLEDVAGGERRVLFMSEDVTAQVAAEAARRRSLDRLTALHAIDRAILEVRPLDDLAAIAIDHLRAVLGIDRITIGILDPDGEWLTLHATREPGSDPATPPRRGRVADLPSPGMKDVRQPVAWPDIAQAGPAFAGIAALAQHGFASGAVVPLLDRERPVGFMGLVSRTPRDFAGEDLEMATEVADQLAIAVRQQRQVEQLERRALRLAGLRELDDAVLAAGDPAEIARVGLEHLNRLVPLRRAAVTEFDPTGTTVTLLAVTVSDGRAIWPPQIVYPVEAFRPIPARLAATRGPIEIDLATADDLGPIFSAVRDDGVTWVLATALAAGGELFGSLNVGTVSPDGLDEEGAATVAEVADRLAIALRQARYREELERRATRLGHLRRLDQAILEAADTTAMLSAAGHEARATTGADLVFVAEYDTDAGVGVARLVDGVVPGAVQTGDTFPLTRLLTPELLAAPAPVEVADLGAVEAPQPFMARLAANGIRSVALRPLTSSGQLVGSLGLAWLRPDAITAAHREIMDEVADALAVAVRQARLRREVADREARLRAILDGSPSPMLVIDARGTITFANPAAARAFRAAGDLPGRPIGDLVPVPAQDGHAANVVRFFEERPDPATVHRFGVDARRLDGTTFPATIDLAPIADGGEEVIVMLSDLSERVALERQLSQAQRMEVLGQFAGILAHDVRNYITAIAWAAGSLAKDLPGPSPLREDVVLIERAVEEARAMVGSVLEYAKPEPLGDRMHLAEHLDRVGGILARLLGPTIDLETDIDPALPGLAFAPGAMTQVLVNLAVNARDAIAGAGRVVISARAADLVADDASGPLPPGTYVELRFSDSGAGMDEATARRAFEAFYTTRGDEPRAAGTGLGLASVFLLVTRARGSVRVESEPGRGTTFVILLPAARDDAASVPASG